MIEKVKEVLEKVNNFEKKGPNIESYSKKNQDIDLNYDSIYQEKKSESETVKTKNEKLEGKTHPETGVPFEKKEVDTPEGKKEGVFPEFDSEVDVYLPEDLEQSSDSKQFKYCNDQLKEKVANDPELRKKFTEEQLEQIEDNETPDGYTWHHSEEKGKMELVDSETHSKTGHTGGKVIWGGGSENR
ncbi:MAG: HNH endonuclease [Fusobacteriaceae bacterium]